MSLDRRKTGYYWVKFNWPAHGRPEPHWEVASWDAKVKTWIMFGSREQIPGEREREVFLAIDELPIRPPS